MPRRPSKKSKGKPRGVNRFEAKINKWNDRSDIPLDEEDEFHASRDEILLDGNRNYEDEDMEDDEVFALKGMPEDDDEEEEEEDEEIIDEEDEEADLDEGLKASKKTKKKKSKGKESSESEEESEEETWGRSKSAYYSSNAAQLESDDEEGNRLEEQEAKKLQGKSRDDLEDNDFGLNDPIEVAAASNTEASVLEEPIAPSIQPALQDKRSIIRHLEKTDPESLALARDWTDTAQALIKAKHKLEQLESEGSEALSQGMAHLHYQALLTYATTLAFYLHLRASAKYAQKPEMLKSHPIMKRLLNLKQSLITLEDLDFAVSDDDDENDDDDFDLDADDMMVDAEKLWNDDYSESVDPDELDDLLADAQPGLKIKLKLKPRPKDPETITAPPKKKRKTAPESGKSAIPVFDLVEPEFTTSSKPSSYHMQPTSADAFGEATVLQHADAADKNARRKSLRFHTSRIESTSAKRQGARNALGGDDDIPYRERKKEREDRLAREAKARVKSQGGIDLDDTDPEPRGQVDDDDGEDDDGYYELVKRQTREKKEKKKAEHDAARAERLVAEEEAASGPRSLTRAILANKGLTPHRPKSVRNPRVKKRQRFEKAKKKVASQKAVFKGGVSATGGRYEGEKSGISKVVKSVRLS